MTNTAESTTSADDAQDGFSEAEKLAMKERAREVKKAARSSAEKADGLADVLAKIADMPEPDHGIAERLHELITTTAPLLDPKTYYGMPAYARDGKVVLFFKPASKFKARYATLGFGEAAHLDEGDLWPTEFALLKLTPAVEAQITALVQKAAGQA